MYTYGKSVRFGCAALIWALGIRLLSGPFPGWIWEQAHRPEFLTFITYMVTGRDLREAPEAYIPKFVESPPPKRQETTNEKKVLSFSGTDAQNISVVYGCNLRPDLQALLEQPLFFSPEGPKVLILSTHSTESYRKNGEIYKETVPFRSLDPEYNMLSLGRRVEEILEQRGVGVIRDDTVHDYPSYNGAYTHARRSIQSILEEYPSVQIVLDLHRDAADSGSGQLRTCASVEGRETAQLMLVMGTNASGLSHDNWEQNLSLGLKLQVQLERMAPGITRPLSLRAQRFNQDLNTGALLVEIGAAGNSHEEALAAAEILAEAMAEIIKSFSS